MGSRLPARAMGFVRYGREEEIETDFPYFLPYDAPRKRAKGEKSLTFQWWAVVGSNH